MAHPLELNDGNFSQEVDKSNLPVLVDFWAPWCGPCRMVGPVIEQLADHYAGRVKVAKCNTDENPGVASAFGIRSIPTVVLLDRGQVVDVMIGARPRADFEKMIDRYLKKIGASVKPATA